MKIPPEATKILRRMNRRGFSDCQIRTWLRSGRRRYDVIVEGMVTYGGKRRRRRYDSADHSTILACCRDIEKQWKESHDET